MTRSAAPDACKWKRKPYSAADGSNRERPLTADPKPTASASPRAYSATGIAGTDAFLSGILAIATDAIISIDDKHKIILFNYGAEQIFGYAPDEVLGQSLEVLLPLRHRAAHPQHINEFAVASAPSRRMGERGAISGLRKSGEEFPAEASISRVESDGRMIATVVLRDVTERRKVEALMERHNAELETRVADRTQALNDELVRRDQMQAALVKSQRLEAVGQLTGGVAHDFNNLLTVISGNHELLEARLTEPKSLELLKRAHEAADMAARLTSRLLTFARRSRLEPVLLNLNEQVLNMSELLKRTLGEHIALKAVLAEALWSTRADPSEVENAVLNLAINARDAMPNGGRLVIQTENAAIDPSAARGEAGQIAGEFVRLSVTDTGIGMTADVLARAFEPFFSTKEAGRGTGLGLSTIYGFAQQSGGFAQIYSEVGEGTTVNIYLPRAGAVEQVAQVRAADGIQFSEHGETILVVEDNEAVREVALQRLEGLGYAVLEAASGAEAIAILETGADIALVFSDVVMAGGTSGFDLARWMAQYRPDMRVLLTSGFAAEALQDQASDAGGPRLLRKPYNRLDLSVALRHALTTVPAKT
jgi:PAS domain S-box-containing protein